MQEVLFGDCLEHIANQSKPVDVYTLSFVCKHYKNKFNQKYFEIRTLKEINCRLSNILGDDIDNLKNELQNKNWALYSDFIIQCALEEEIITENHTKINVITRNQFEDYIYESRMTRHFPKEIMIKNKHVFYDGSCYDFPLNDIFGSHYWFDGIDHIHFVNFNNLFQKIITYDPKMIVHDVYDIQMQYDQRGFTYNQSYAINLEILENDEEIIAFTVKKNPEKHQKCGNKNIDTFLDIYEILHGDASRVNVRDTYHKNECYWDCETIYLFPNMKHHHFEPQRPYDQNYQKIIFIEL